MLGAHHLVTSGPARIELIAGLVEWVGSYARCRILPLIVLAVLVEAAESARLDLLLASHLGWFQVWDLV